MSHKNSESRRYPRASGRFVVSYRILEGRADVDISHTKNLSLGGMLLTTNRKFAVNTNLILEIKLPSDPNSIMLIGKVVESREVSKYLIYDTRIEFLAVDEAHKKIISKTIGYYL